MGDILQRNLPQHIGLIMDGNGRWAKKRGLPRTSGHLEGLEAAKRVVRAASQLGIKYLTLYTFSTENWRRAEEEVSFLMGLISKHLVRELDFYRENHVRVLHSGYRSGLPVNIQQELQRVEEDTSHFDGLTVILAINYGGRDEIIRAVNRWRNNGSSEKALTEELLKSYLDQPDAPDPDLIIRTGGEVRTSNFLLWESAYSEYYFTETLWPDYSSEDLESAISSFAQRGRRFGGTP